jgi:hypothetical protein
VIYEHLERILRNIHWKLPTSGLEKLTARKETKWSVKKKSVIFLVERSALQVRFSSAGDFFGSFFYH